MGRDPGLAPGLLGRDAGFFRDPVAGGLVYTTEVYQHSLGLCLSSAPLLEAPLPRKGVKTN